MADKEIKRRDCIEKKLDYICRQLAQLEIMQAQVPKIGAESTQLENRTLDVLSATFSFLTVNIKSETTRFGTIGKWSSRLENELTLIRKTCSSSSKG